jgi:hypothetical protein
MRRTATPMSRRRATERELRRVQAYVKLAAPEPDVLRLIGEESRRNGTDKLTSHQINRIICETRARMKAEANRSSSAK